jgi:two-component system nitrogen regulation response regulator NtrX
VKILVVDDEAAIRESLDLVLRFEHHEVVLAEDGERALQILARDPNIELTFLDVKMPGRDGLQILPAMVEARPDALVVMISGHGTIDTAVEATRKGAFDFIEKPLDRDRVLLTVRNAAALRRLAGENVELRGRLSDASRRMIGESRAMRDLRALTAKVAPTQARVLVTGEHGSGKELVARLLHETSARAKGPFVDVNCAAIPKDLLESELFGHEKGAFTGATEQRKGKFEQAHGGTLFLDEVGDMSLEAQAKVLRVIEEQRVQRVGGTAPIPVDVRLVAATNKDLAQEAEQGAFREDLYYRLAVVPVRVPSLRERLEDVPALARHFIEQFAAGLGRQAPRVSDAAAAWLQDQPWPGNVRQLRNLCERVAILVDGPSLEVADLERLAGPPGAAVGDAMDVFRTCATFEEFRETAEKVFLQQHLAQNDWNVKRTAESLGMQRSNLYKKIERHNLKSPGEAVPAGGHGGVHRLRPERPGEGAGEAPQRPRGGRGIVGSRERGASGRPRPGVCKRSPQEAARCPEDGPPPQARLGPSSVPACSSPRCSCSAPRPRASRRPTRRPPPLRGSSRPGAGSIRTAWSP